MTQTITTSYSGGYLTRSHAIWTPATNPRFHDWPNLACAVSYFNACVANLETLGHDRVPSASVNHITPKGNLIKSETYEIYDSLIHKQVTRTLTLTASEQPT